MSTVFDSPLPRRAARLLLLLIVIAGFTLRTWNVNFDQGLGTHPDERSTSCLYAPTIRLPASWEEFKDPKRSPLNPLWDTARQERRSFTYGHFPLYLGIAMSELFHVAAPVAERLGAPAETVALMARSDEACDGIAVAGRLTIALLDTATIILLYALGVRMYGRGAGLLAAAFYAFAAQAVQLSHFFAMDPASTTFTVLAVLGSVRFLQSARLGDALLASVAVGLAVSSKFSALPVLGVPWLAALLLFAGVSGPAALPRGRRRFNALVAAALAPLVGFAVFLLTSPYSVLDWRNFLDVTLVEQGLMVRGIADWPFTRQYRNTTPYLYFIEQQVRWGLGWPLGLLALAGTAWALWSAFAGLYRRVRRGVDLPPHWAYTLVALSWVLVYFGVTGAFLAKFNRYMSPVLPFALLFAAGWLAALWNSRNTENTEISTTEDTEFTEGIEKGERVEEEKRGWEGAVVGGARSFAPAKASFSTTSAAVNPSKIFSPRPPSVFSVPSVVVKSFAALLAVVGVAWGLFWSVAYVSGVYGRDHTWISASRWMYEHIPASSAILWEQWDDPLPKSLPDEPGMDMGSRGLYNIDWGPYEEDTAQKFDLLKQSLRAADYVAYSSKRIYDSVDELPERYPMTTLYYEAMWDGRLGFELALEETSFPGLFGFEFDDRHADESWSLYDHPQVTVFRKVRDLSDAEFDALFDNNWETARPYYVGEERRGPLAWALTRLGLGSAPSSQESGLLNFAIGLLMDRPGSSGPTPPPENPNLLLDAPLSELPVVDDYRWNRAASESEPLAVLWWWLVSSLLGWAAWPIFFPLFRALRDRGYFLARSLGWLLAGWLLWWAASLGLLQNTVRNAWLVAGGVALLGALAAWRSRAALGAFLRTRWPLLLAGEGLFAAAYIVFVFIRMGNPDLWQPWVGGEKFMEFAFLNGILRSPTFPPVDPHFAGGYINYYYFGIYLVAYLIKLTGIYAEVAFNLAIPMLFALTVVNSFAVAYSAWGTLSARRQSAVARSWRWGFAPALLASLFLALIGNLDGFAQIARRLAEQSGSGFRSALPLVQTSVRAVQGVFAAVRGAPIQIGYDFWTPSRVIDFTINEFPYWSFLFADLHPHLIGIPFAVAFLALVYTLLADRSLFRRFEPGRTAALLGLFALLLGALASVNLWELPTYLALGALALLAAQWGAWGRVRWGWTLAGVGLYAGGALAAFAPFFGSYIAVGAGGVGFVPEGDPLGRWLLIWGFLLFILGTWTLLETARRPAGVRMGAARLLSAAFRRFERLPRLLYLHRLLVRRPTAAYLAAVWLLPLALAAAAPALFWGRPVLALCLPFLALSFLLIWRRDAGPAGRFVALAATAGFAVLAGTQVVYLRDFLDGGDWRRMNTLFKFFSQVWVIWGVAAGVALPRIAMIFNTENAEVSTTEDTEFTEREKREEERERREDTEDEQDKVDKEAEEVGLGLLGEGGEASGARSVAAAVYGGEDGGPSPAPREHAAEPWPALSTLSVSAPNPSASSVASVVKVLWWLAFAVLLAASLAFPLVGTPARLNERMVGWRPAFGTLNGLDYMRQGIYTWPDTNVIELSYDWEAVQWVLDNLCGNYTVLESSEADYYRAGSSRIASLTGLSAPRGFHAGEQRFSAAVGRRDGLHREFWDAPDIARTQEIMAELNASLVYVGQIERTLHPAGVAKVEQMAAAGLLTPLFANERATLYAVPGALTQNQKGCFVPA